MHCTRRTFFTEIGRSILSDLADTVRAVSGVGLGEPTGQTSPARPTWLRPPGALPEPLFLTTCTKCTACQEACPYQSIRRLGPEFGEATGTPAIIPTESPCYLCDDMPCIAACEPLALRPLARHEVVMGTAEIRMADCYIAQGQPCDYCVARCPLKGVAIGFDDASLPRVYEDSCSGCGVCAYLCPGSAISVRPVHGVGATITPK